MKGISWFQLFFGDDSLLSFIHGIPTLHLVSDSTSIKGDSRNRDYSAVRLKCGNLAVVIFGWLIIGDGATISSNDEFLVRNLKRDQSSGADLGVCRAVNTEDQGQKAFHAIIQSGDDSIVSGNHGKQLTCYGCSLIISTDDKRWFEVIGTITRRSSERDPSTPLP